MNINPNDFRQAAPVAIETNYKGWRMRSRLEARWAVYFDALGIKFIYEHEGYDLGELGFYLPDFFLPQVKMWAEVKPVPFTDIEIQKCNALAKGTGHPCLMLVDFPDLKPYWAREPIDLEWMPENDYLIDNTYLEEHRFFGCTDIDRGETCPNRFSKDAKAAVLAARAARFEHGESGASRK